jgi:hypothetical protein
MPGSSAWHLPQNQFFLHNDTHAASLHPTPPPTQDTLDEEQAPEGFLLEGAVPEATAEPAAAEGTANGAAKEGGKAAAAAADDDDDVVLVDEPAAAGGAGSKRGRGEGSGAAPARKRAKVDGKGGDDAPIELMDDDDDAPIELD